MKRFAFILCLIAAATAPAMSREVQAAGEARAAQDEFLPEDKVIVFEGGKSYDFGDVLVKDGELSCEFTFRNVCDTPILIYNIVSSCGCTKPRWPAEEIMPGEKGKIGVTFANDQGPYPFDKTLTVYVSKVSRPVLLHVRGVVHEKNKPLGDRFPIHLGKAGWRKMQYSLNYLDRGGSEKSDRATIANLGNKPMKITPVELSNGLKIEVSPNPIEPLSTATLTYTVDAKTLKDDLWGRTIFTARFEIDGRRYDKPLEITAFIKEGFTAQQAKDPDAPKIEAEKSYSEFGNVPSGTKASASFTVKNTGKKPLKIHKIESDSKAVMPLQNAPLTIAPGAKAEIGATIDTKGRSGDTLYTLELITNAPSKPVLKLFISGIIL